MSPYMYACIMDMLRLDPALQKFATAYDDVIA